MRIVVLQTVVQFFATLAVRACAPASSVVIDVQLLLCGPHSPPTCNATYAYLHAQKSPCMLYLYYYLGNNMLPARPHMGVGVRCNPGQGILGY